MSEPRKLWTPGQKMPPRVAQMAFALFAEHFKASFTNRQVADEWRDDEKVYRRCVQMAETIYKIENEEKPHD